mmetsp:Transcript_14246/g.43752  ORF Transcript_14246/g.43752 Transcript_14246/m.43752 type:complete len:143 (+) Transcript_14246:113-541(+)
MSVQFGFSQGEKKRKQRQLAERKAREYEKLECQQMEHSIRARLQNGDLKERVMTQVLELMNTPEIKKRVEKRSSDLTALKRAQALNAIACERKNKVAEARRKEEDRLNEAQRLQDILDENRRRVEEEARRRAEAETRAKLEK